MLPLKLNVNPVGWRLFMRRKVDPRFSYFSNKIFVRDKFCCRFCGLQSKSHHQIINLDHDYYNNALSNLATACVFCTQCVFLESVGAGGQVGGVLIFLPEIQQNYLNGLCHLLFAAMHNNAENKELAQNVYRHFKSRAQIIEDEWGENMQNPVVFAQLLIESGQKSTFFEKELFRSIRLLPSRTVFKSEDGLQNTSLIT